MALFLLWKCQTSHSAHRIEGQRFRFKLLTLKLSTSSKLLTNLEPRKLPKSASSMAGTPLPNRGNFQICTNIPLYTQKAGKSASRSCPRAQNHQRWALVGNHGLPPTVFGARAVGEHPLRKAKRLLGVQSVFSSGCSRIKRYAFTRVEAREQ
jgi:hypothetical protein